VAYTAQTSLSIPVGGDAVEAGVWSALGSATHVAWFADTDGNILSSTQFQDQAP